MGPEADLSARQSDILFLVILQSQAVESLFWATNGSDVKFFNGLLNLSRYLSMFVPAQMIWSRYFRNYFMPHLTNPQKKNIIESGLLLVFSIQYVKYKKNFEPIRLLNIIYYI